ncbi:hypothetical protein EB796_012022 [Bugula neritina]|uniref:Uncharacterized protein n=1 Tax=Bugula neritina TaxID=10212 RepID=A0A7J7JVF9_BUGNE|nr:hypothetical protein EB796_012022 [Bugula neritina]
MLGALRKAHPHLLLSQHKVVTCNLMIGFSSLPLPKHPTVKPKIDYDNLPEISMKLFSAGINQVSAKIMIDKTFSFNEKTKVLKV